MKLFKGKKGFYAALAAVSMTVVSAAGISWARGSSNTAASFDVNDSTAAGTMMIRSDGGGTYSNGIDNVNSYIYPASSTTTDYFQASLRYRCSGPCRVMNIDFSQPVDPSNAPFSGVYTVQNILTVNGLLDIPIGATALEIAHTSWATSSKSDYIIWWGSQPNTNPVTVTRLSANQWHVVSNPTDVAFVNHNDGAATGYYYLPLDVIITSN